MLTERFASYSHRRVVRDLLLSRTHKAMLVDTFVMSTTYNVESKCFVSFLVHVRMSRHASRSLKQAYGHFINVLGSQHVNENVESP